MRSVRLTDSPSRRRLVIRLVSPDLLGTLGAGVQRLDLFYLLAFALTVALGLRYLGVLLMGSLMPGVVGTEEPAELALTDDRYSYRFRSRRE